jgi:pimeloyl-ACP methyl ester carboxylesterase
MLKRAMLGPRALLRHTPKPASPDLEALIHEILDAENFTSISPTPDDHVVFLRGVPIAPWIHLRPADEVWRLWLGRLRELSQTWRNETSQTSNPPRDWQFWRATNVHMLQQDKVAVGVAELSSLLAEHASESGRAHLIGHSAGGAIALAYLSALRAGRIVGPQLPVCSVITLDAAVAGAAGAAGIWSGATRYLHETGSTNWDELHTWAMQRGIAALTVANSRDMWSHHALGDLPYLGLRLGPSVALLSQVDGAIHDMLRRMPQLVQAIWEGDSSAEQGDSAVQALDTSEDDTAPSALTR